MKKETKDKWIAALRSGEYQQADRKLKNGSGFCCLGVLACVTGLEISPDGGSIVENGETVDYGPLTRLFNDHTVFTDPKHSDIDRHNMEVFYIMNDVYKYDFKKIADWIEENVRVTE